jgi:serine/threonine protein kinase
MSTTPDALADTCLDEEAALEFAAGRLEAANIARIEQHLDRCGACQDMLEAAMQALAPDAPADAATLRPGARLANRYRVVRFIGKGGMGEIYEVLDEALGAALALKRLAPRVSDNPKSVAYLKSEVQLARRVSHPNVCRVYDFGMHEEPEQPPVYFLTMELLGGETLGQRVRKGPLPLREVWDIARQLLFGLREAHRVGVLHRDFKSDNVMFRVAEAGAPREVAVTDFGLARAFSQGRSHITTSQLFVGSAAYMAPEQVEGGRLGPATDIYSFGIVVFEMLTGCLPFVAETAVATAALRLRQRAPRPSEVLSSIPRAWDDFVLRCLEREADARFASADAALAELEHVRDPTRSARRTLLRRAAVAALVGGLGLAGVLFVRPPDSRSKEPVVHAQPPTPVRAAVLPSKPRAEPVPAIAPDAASVAPERQVRLAGARKPAASPRPSASVPSSEARDVSAASSLHDESDKLVNPFR